MKKQTIIAAKWRIAAICFFLLWALSGFAQQASITNLATDYTAKKISFTVKWTAAPHDNKIWVITDYVKIEGATTVGPWSRALVTNVSASTGTATIYSNGRGFLLTTSGVNGSANITATLISSMPARFSWCAFALNYPPRAVLNASGWYDLKGTKPFVVNETPLGNDVNTYTGGCITSLTDATNNPHAIIPGPPTITAVNSPTICYNTAANLTATVAGDITAAMTYTWNIGGTITTTTVPAKTTGNLTTNTTYTVTAKNAAGCTSAVSNTGTITVLEAFSPGEIAATGETICYADTPGMIDNITAASGGDGHITYQWRYATSRPFSGATASSYAPDAATIQLYSDTGNTFTITRWAKDGTCNTTPMQSTGTWILTVHGALNSGMIVSTGQTICSGDTPDVIGNQISATGSDGNITYQWRHNGETIPGATATSYTPAASYSQTAGTHTFTRWAKDDGCNTTPVQSTGEWVLTVNTGLDPGSITTSGETVCYGNTPTKSISNTPATGGGNITYEWRHNGVAIPGATLASYTPAASYSQTAGAHTFTRWA
ncbi:MAG: hypothetical protein LBG31_06840, partial [Prevotellaceae bacterium]|nr:hypothetical protein [Prevotellaceae bacterium]